MSVKVERVQIKNFKALSEVDLQVDGKHVYVIGPNDHGKSSFLDFIFGFTGKALSKDLTLEKPSEMITKGQDKMEGTIDMGDYQIVVKGKRVKGTEKINIELYRDGEEMKSPRTLLDELIGVNNFDIDGFLRKSEKDQVAFYKTILGIGPELDKLDSKYEQKFKERTDLNRDIKKAEAELESVQIPLRGITRPEPVDLNAALAGRKEAELALNEHENKCKRVESLEEGYSAAQRLLDDDKVQLQQLEERMKHLQATIQKRETEMAEIKVNLDRGRKWKESAVKPELPDVTELVAKANETNALVAKFQFLDTAKKKVDDYHKELSGMEDEMETIDKQRKDLIAKAEHPVPNMTFDNEHGLLYKGLPFKSSQINTATKIVIALQLQRPLMAQARFVRFDASLLDVKSMELVKQWAAKYDLQLFMEVVDRQAEGGLKFELEEAIEPQEVETEVGF